MKTFYHSRYNVKEIWKQSRSQILVNHILVKIYEKAFVDLETYCENDINSVCKIKKFKDMTEPLKPQEADKKTQEETMELIFHSPPARNSYSSRKSEGDTRNLPELEG